MLSASPRPPSRAGFTLVELLVAVAIIIALTVLVVTTLNWNANKERIATEARAVASFLEGARDRAIHESSSHQDYKTFAVGVRLILDEQGPANDQGNPICASSLVYVELPPAVPLVVDIDPADRRSLTFRGDDLVAFEAGDRKGLYGDAFELHFAGVGRIVAVRTATGWRLNKDWPAGNSAGWSGRRAVAVPRFPRVRPNEEPRTLARGVVIDLETMRRANRLPAGWYDSSAEAFRERRMNLMFDPQGRVTASVDLGMSTPTLLLAAAEDVETTVYGGTLYDLDSRPQHPLERFVSISPAGSIRVRPINLADSDGNGVPDDPFAFADGVN